MTALTQELREKVASGVLVTEDAILIPALALARESIARSVQMSAYDVQILAGIAASLHKFALDFRLLQSPLFGEWAEPFGRKQVGSTAMPFKRNPVGSENICSLARYVAGLPAVAWDNASLVSIGSSLP